VVNNTSRTEGMSIQKVKYSKKNAHHAQRMKLVREAFARERGLDKLSQANFARIVGINPSRISHIEAGNTRIGIELAGLIEEKTGFRQAWLLTGERPEKVSDAGRYDEGVRGPRKDRESGFTEQSGHHFSFVKKVKPHLNGGSGELTSDEEAEGIYAFRTDWLKSRWPAASMRLAQVSGDSMYPTLKDGDLVLFDVTERYPIDGKIMVVGIDDLVYIKRLRRTHQGMFLVSDNSAVYEPWRIDPEETKFLGLVLWHCGEL